MDGVDQTYPSVLVHYHIYKNAGSSIDRILRDSLGGRWSTFEGSGEAQPVTSDEVAGFLTERPELLAVSSHLARPPLPAPHVSPIVMLRHPIDRARSVYHYARRDPTMADHQAAREGSFRDYVEWSLGTPGVGVVIRNYQVIHLSAASFRYPDIQLAQAVEADLAEVKELLLGWPAFGIVRAFADSCRLFQSVYGSRVAGLRFTHRRENRSTGTFLTEAKSIDRARSELGEAVFQKLVEANRLDLDLYEFANRQFRNRLARLEQGWAGMQLHDGIGRSAAAAFVSTARSCWSKMHRQQSAPAISRRIRTSVIPR